MNKQAFTAVFVALLITALTLTLLINFAAANPTPPAPLLEVDIISPQNGETIRNTLEVTFKYSKPLTTYSFLNYYYVLDGQEWVAFSPNKSGDTYCTTLPILPNGEHNLTIIVTAREAPDQSGYGGNSRPVHFTVDYAAPTVTVSPLENSTSTGTGAAFGFRVRDYSLSWVSYSLDGEENVTVSSEALAQTKLGPLKAWCGNLSFTGLSGGEHNLTVYAGNEVGCTGASEPFCFTVAQDAEPMPLLLAAASASAVAIGVLASILFYFKRHKLRVN